MICAGKRVPEHGAVYRNLFVLEAWLKAPSSFGRALRKTHGTSLRGFYSRRVERLKMPYRSPYVGAYYLGSGDALLQKSRL
jgi:hypothetical protein